jgi:hypothetical protein
MEQDEPSPSRTRRYAQTAAVLLAQVALVAALYPSPSRFFFVADPWPIMLRLRGDLLPALLHPIGYHWQPVAYAWVEAIRRVFGENPAVFQTINLGQLVSLGYLTYALGRRATGDAAIGFLASVLYLGSASYYEATYWAYAGNMHLVGAQLYMAALVLAWDTGEGRRPRAGAWLVGVAALGAVLGHPAMATVVPVAGLTIVLVAREKGRPLGRPERRALAMLALTAAVAIGTRLVVQRIVHGLPQPGFGREHWYGIALAMVQMVTMRGSRIFAHAVVGFGQAVNLSSPLLLLGTALWTMGPLLAAAGGWLLVRRAGFRVVVAFFAIHVYVAGLAAGLPSRQIILAQVPVALLTAWGLCALAARMARGRTPAAAALAQQLPAFAALLLVLGAGRDHRVAMRITLRAGDTVRGFYRAVRAEAPIDGPVRHVVLVNLPHAYTEGGLSTQVLGNGAGEIPRMASHPETIVGIGTAPLPNGAVYQVPGHPLSIAHLRARVQDPGQVVLVFQNPPHLVRRLTPRNIEAIISGY